MHHGGSELYNTLELDDRKPCDLHWIVAAKFNKNRKAEVQAQPLRVGVPKAGASRDVRGSKAVKSIGGGPCELQKNA
jgi:hypothetical protein